MTSTSTSPIDLILEESTIDPKSPLPSFLEIILLERASHSARNVLKSIIEALSSHISHYLRTQQARGTGREGIAFIQEVQRNITLRITHIILKLCNTYKLELQFILTYFIEKHVLMTYGFDATASESLFNFKRSRIYNGNNNHTTTFKNRKQNETQAMRIEPMKNSDRIKAALLLAFIPYMAEKTKEIYEVEKERRRQQMQQQQQQQQQQNFNYNNTSNRFNHGNRQPSSTLGIMKKKIHSFFFNIYPFLHLSTEGINTAYYFLYLIGKSIYYNPSLHLLGQVVRRCTIADLEEKKKQNQKLDQSSSGNSNSSSSSSSSIEEEGGTRPLIFNPDSASSSSSFKNLKSSAATGLCIALCVGWMGQLRRELRRRRRQRFFAREEGLHSITMSSIASAATTNIRNHSSSSSTTNELDSNLNHNQDGDFITNNRIAIPPPLPPIIRSMSNANNDPSLCPLCGQTRVNPVASSSGFVFCYKCITLFIRENGEKCPVTGMRCAESQLIRIYESTNSAV